MRRSTAAKATAVAFVAASLPLSTSAQVEAAASAATSTRLDDITVSASTSRLPTGEGALPNTITVIPREALEAQLAVTTDLSQILGNLLPAFSPARQKLTDSGESLRGRQPLYLIDGVPQSNPLRNGRREAHTIDPALIERIEVIHGANALHGLGASGGIINIITRKPAADGSALTRVTLGATAPTDGGSDGLGGRGSVLAARDLGAFDATGGIAWERHGRYYDGEGRPIGVDNTQGDLMDSESWSLFGKFGYAFDAERRLQLMINRYALDGDGDYLPVQGDPAQNRPTTSVRGAPEGEAPNNRVMTTSLDYSDAGLAGGTLRAQLFLQRFRAVYGGGRFPSFQDPNFGSNLFDQSRNVSDKTGGKFDWGVRGLIGGRLNLLAGVDLLQDSTYQDLVHTGRKWVPETVYESAAPLLQSEWWFGNRASLSAGLRYESGRLAADSFRTLYSTNPGSGGVTVDGGSQRFEELLPNAGLVVYLSDHLNLFASYAEGYTMPDVGRVLRAIGTEGQDVDTLFDLDPVISDNNEIGLDYDDGSWLVHLSAYRSDSTRGARLVYDAANQVFNVQRQRVEIRGWEARTGFRPRPDTRIDLAFAAARGRSDNDGDGRVDSDLDGANIGPDRLNLAWQQDWPARVTSRLQLSHVMSRDFEFVSGTTAAFDAYTTLDGQVTLATARAGEWTLGVENLADAQYLTYHAQTVGRNPDDYHAGRGRSVSLTWAYAF